MTTPPRKVPPDFQDGALCLAFVNTWGDRGSPEADGLGSYEQLLAFAKQLGALDAAAIDELAARSADRPAEAGAALAAARELRESLFRLLAGVARGRATADADLEPLNAALFAARASLRLERSAAAVASFAWRWEAPGSSLSAPLWPIARSAANLLTSAELTRVRECDGTSCNWLFFDRSRGGSRRWCSMESCGNRAKARRHYRRRRVPGEAAARPPVA